MTTTGLLIADTPPPSAITLIFRKDNTDALEGLLRETNSWRSTPSKSGHNKALLATLTSDPTPFLEDFPPPTTAPSLSSSTFPITPTPSSAFETLLDTTFTSSTEEADVAPPSAIPSAYRSTGERFL
ncbi:hypothetical protein EDB85DRAFT_2272379 [Lactarius pseudohatsudake]|nr:hypothetical protein EDB85DRAFT_2272379 [Lactarius pseudohatsudake]